MELVISIATIFLSLIVGTVCIFLLSYTIKGIVNIVNTRITNKKSRRR